MAPTKEEEARGEQLPAYNELPGPSSAAPENSQAPVELPAEVPGDLPTVGPTVSSPFNFPSDAQLPAYTSPPTSEPAEQRPIAIPQIKADPTAPFFNAYSPHLLRHGITQETWSAFLHTLSGFLAATVSQKAVSHAAETARNLGDGPKRFGRETWAHAKRTGHHISDSAKKGNYAGAAVGVVAGTVALPVATTIRAIGASISFSFATLGAVTRSPKTPRERAVAYAESANVKWLRRRGLEAHLLDTAELARALSAGAGGEVSAQEILRLARSAVGYPSAAAQLAALAARIVELEMRTPGQPLELEAGTLWLVVTQKGEDGDDGHGSEDHGHHRGGEKGKGRGK